MPKKLVAVPIEDLVDAALMESKNYPLIQDNDDIAALFKNKFKTTAGIQVPPKEFIDKIIDHIENNPPQSTEEFAVFVRTTIAAVRAPIAAKKKHFWSRR